MAGLSSMRRLVEQTARVFHPAGTLLAAWAALDILLGPGKGRWPRVFGGFWVQIPGISLQAALLAAVALVAMWRAARAVGWLRPAHGALAVLAVMLQVREAGFAFWASYQEASVVERNSMAVERKRADTLARLSAKEGQASQRGEPLFPSRQRAGFFYRVFGIATTYREAGDKEIRLFAPTPAEESQWATTKRGLELEQHLLDMLVTQSFDFFRLGCISLGGLGLTALGAAVGASRLRRDVRREETDGARLIATP
jgi:hypothetical protein